MTAYDVFSAGDDPRWRPVDLAEEGPRARKANAEANAGEKTIKLKLSQALALADGDRDEAVEKLRKRIRKLAAAGESEVSEASLAEARELADRDYDERMIGRVRQRMAETGESFNDAARYVV